MNNFFALIVGVGGNGFTETIKDAEAIRTVLTTRGAYDPANTFFLTENNSTKLKVIDAFDQLIKKAEQTKDATVFIYYSGHGQRYKTQDNEFDYYLKTHGADENDKENTMLNGDIFSEKVDKIKAERVLVMLDCCYAGGIKNDALKLKGAEEIEYSNRALQEKLSAGKGRVFVSSCDDNETSVILPNAENSLFTEVALEALKGLITPPDEEYVSVIDLIHHVLKTVPKKIKKFKHNQNPILTEVKDLNYEYTICKNGNWQTAASNSSISISALEKGPTINNITPNITHINDLEHNDKQIVNSFFKQINTKNIINNEVKIDFINKLGGIENFKIVNEKLNDLELIKSSKKTKIKINKDVINMLAKTINQTEKIEFIKNYKYKI